MAAPAYPLSSLPIKDLIDKIKKNSSLPDSLEEITFELGGTPYEIQLSRVGEATFQGQITLTDDPAVEDFAEGAGWEDSVPAALMRLFVPAGETTVTVNVSSSEPHLSLETLAGNKETLFLAAFGRIGANTWFATALSPKFKDSKPDLVDLNLPVASKALGGPIGIGDLAVSFAAKGTPTGFLADHKKLFGKKLGQTGNALEAARLAVVVWAYLGKNEYPLEVMLAGNGMTPRKEGTTTSEDEAVSGSAKVEKEAFGVLLQKIGFSLEPKGLVREAWSTVFNIKPQITASLGPIKVDFSRLNFILEWEWKDRRPRFTASGKFLGMGLGMDTPAIQLGGSLAKSEGDVYTGAAFVGVGVGSFNLALSAIGGYFQDQTGRVSLFLYAVLGISKKDSELAASGGPFQITALVFGFGLNYEVMIPAIEDVALFPLVRAATDPGFLGPNPDAENVFDLVETSLQPSPGVYWGAAGAEMLLFGMIRGFVLFVMQGKQDYGVTDIAVLGMFSLKKKLKDRTIVDVSMAVKAHVALQSGMAEFRAQIVEGSYFITESCKVRGGMAFCIWWKGGQAGDWVFTIGGYHPRYPAPAHYPKERRLGAYWSASSAITFEAELYLAITRSAFMVGGRYAFVFQTGPLRAWAGFFFDALVSWDPVYFDIQLGVSLGASITIWLFGKRTIGVSLGIKLALWGPPIAGRAEFKVVGIKFSFSFGKDKVSHDPPLAFAHFVNTMLLPKSSATRSGEPASVVNIQFEKGVLADLTRTDSGLDYVVDPFDLEFSIQTQVPAKNASLNSTGLSRSWNSSFGNQPCNLKNDELESDFAIEIKRVAGNEKVDFVCTPSLASSPRALWDPAGKTDVKLSRDEAVENTLTGFAMKPKPPEPGRTLGPIDQKTLVRTRRHFEWIEVEIPGRYEPQPPVIEEIKKTIDVPAIRSKRGQLVAALRRQGLDDLDTELRLDQTAAMAERFLLGSPVLAPLGR